MNFSSDEKKEELSEQEDSIIHVLNSALDKPELRVTGIYGDINEEKCSETVWGLLALHETGKKYYKEEDSEELVEEYTPIDFYISSYGGAAAEMFAVYDVIRGLRDRTPIVTHGVGKVMSAGVLLLASGTKGERRIGKHCRVMIHGVISGQHGHIADVKNEFKETEYTQKLYVEALAEETNMTRSYIKRLMNKKTNVYLNAQQAVELGIADIIF
tara:strand:- start:156 stop:797 length:642 start_codon:yes stop_codon:yes gene_type:complete